MIRNLKALGLAVVAVCAMGALGASSASAVDVFKTDAANGKALLTGVSTTDVLKIEHGGHEFKCSTSRFAGTVENLSTSVTVEPTYTGEIGEVPHNTAHRCTSDLGDLTIDMNGCHYELSGHTTGHDPNPNTDATVWITCPGTNKIAITSATGATITVPPQTPTTGGVTYTNLPLHSGGASVTIKTTNTGITYSCHPTFTCTLGGIKHHGNDANYTGHVIATCWEDKNAPGVITPATEGARVGCSYHTASSASAVDVFTTDAVNGKALLTGTATHSDKFEMTGSGTKFECTLTKLAGTVSNLGTSVTVEAEYTKTKEITPHPAGDHCSSSLGSVTWDMNGCHFELTGHTTGHDPPLVPPHATAWLTCPGTNKIASTNPSTGTTITIPPQTPTTGGVTYTNLPNHTRGASITVTTAATGITYSCHPTFTCTLGGIKHHGNDANYTGHVIVTCWEDNEGLPTPVTEGPRTNCSFHTA